MILELLKHLNPLTEVICHLKILVTSGRALVFEVGCHPLKKIHVIRVVFQDQAMYARTLYRVQKRAKLKKKSMFLGRIDQFWKGHDGQIKKNSRKNAYLGSIFIPEKYVFRVCFESPFMSMISSLIYKCSPRTSGQKRKLLYWRNGLNKNRVGR